MEFIQEKIKSAIVNNSIPGLSLYIFYKGKEKYANYGMQNIEKNIELSNDSIWSARSISKNISATTVAWLMDNKKTSFNTKINKIQNVKFANEYVTENVTINTLTSVSTGTDSIGVNLAKLALYPDATASFYYTNPLQLNSAEMPKLLYTESLSLITLRSIGVAFAYILVFLFIAWLAFKRSQVLE